MSKRVGSHPDNSLTKRVKVNESNTLLSVGYDVLSVIMGFVLDNIYKMGPLSRVCKTFRTIVKKQSRYLLDTTPWSIRVISLAPRAVAFAILGQYDGVWTNNGIVTYNGKGGNNARKIRQSLSGRTIYLQATQSRLSRKPSPIAIIALTPSSATLFGCLRHEDTSSDESMSSDDDEDELGDYDYTKYDCESSE